MKVSVTFSVAPALTYWVKIIRPLGWKITNYTSERLRAKKKIGQSEFPVHNATTWYIEIEENSDCGCTVSITVPCFVDCPYAESRCLEKIRELAEKSPESVQTDAEFDIDMLNLLRERYGSRSY